jgi:hypothetical protein
MGAKVNSMKEICTKIGAPLLTAVQINRSGVANSKTQEVQDDDSVIAQSDKIAWFANFVGIFRLKTSKEVEEDTPKFGTHLLRVLKGRFQGKASMGHNDWVEVKGEDGKSKYRPNYINFNVENFNVEDRLCLRKMLKLRANTQILENKAQENPDDGNIF